MKKILPCLFAVFYALSICTACSNSKDEPTEESWKSLSKTYQSNSLDITLSESPIVITENRTIVVSASSPQAAKFTLNNIVPDDKSIDIDVYLEETNNIYSFSGTSETINGTFVAINGTFENGVLKLLAVRTPNHGITGDPLGLKLIEPEEGESTKIADVYIAFKSSEPTINAMVNTELPMQIGSELMKKFLT